MRELLAWHGEAAQIFQPQPLPARDTAHASMGPATATEPISSLECTESFKNYGSPKVVSKSWQDAVWTRVAVLLLPETASWHRCVHAPLYQSRPEECLHWEALQSSKYIHNGSLNDAPRYEIFLYERCLEARWHRPMLGRDRGALL